MKRYIVWSIALMMVLNMMIPFSVSGKSGRSISGNEAEPSEEISDLISEVTGELAKDINGYTDILNVTVSANAAVRLCDRAFACRGPLSDDECILQEEDFGESSIFAITQNGRYCFAVRDDAGNVDRVYTTVDCIDDEAPGISAATVILTDAVNGFAKKGTLSIAAYDLKSRLHKEAFSFDDGDSYTDSYSMEVTENGIYAVRVRDGLGNEIRKSVVVDCIDNAGPVISIAEYEKKSKVAELNLSIELQEAGCGLSRLYYMDNAEGIKTDIREFEQTKKEQVDFKIVQNGNYTFYAEDALGNVTAKIISLENIEKRSSSSSSSSTAEVTEKEKSTSSSISSGIFNPSITEDDDEKDKKVVININTKDSSSKSTSSSSTNADSVSVKDSSRELLMKLLGSEEEADDNEDEKIEAATENEEELLTAEVVEESVPAFYALEPQVESTHKSISENMAGRVIDVQEQIDHLKAKEDEKAEIKSSSIIMTGMGMMIAFIFAVLVFFKKNGLLRK